jgi:hypothetical protein
VLCVVVIMNSIDDGYSIDSNFYPDNDDGDLPDDEEVNLSSDDEVEELHNLQEQRFD